MKVTLKSAHSIQKNGNTKAGEDGEIFLTTTKEHFDSYTDIMQEELFGRVFEVTPMEKDGKIVPDWFVTVYGPITEVEWNVHRSWLDEVD